MRPKTIYLRGSGLTGITLSFEETLAAVAVGGAFTLGSSIVAQYYLLKRQESEDSKERVYSPLYDEITIVLEQLDEHEMPWTPEWDRINKQEHLTYRIRDAALQKDLRQFYGQTRDGYNRTEGLCTSFYPVLVTGDLNRRLKNKASQTSMSDISAVSQAIGWNLQRDVIPPNFLASASPCYEKLRTLSPDSFEQDDLISYFQWWKDKAALQRQMIEYLQARKQAIDEATSLKEKLGKRLGVENQKPVTGVETVD